MNVLKFGGSSVKDANAILNVYSAVTKIGGKSIVVVSAFASVTNTLVDLIRNIRENNTVAVSSNIDYLHKLHRKNADDINAPNIVYDFISSHFQRLEMLAQSLLIIGEISKRSEDLILSIGEKLSSFIIANSSEKYGLNAAFIDSSEFIITNDNHTEAEVDFEKTEVLCKNNLSPLLDTYDTVFCGGFIATTIDGVQTTLGRGGSDYSAAIIASCLNADSLEIFTDVDGILTCDPNIIPNARLLDTISYSEAAELAFFGAKVLHPKTIFPAIKKDIPVRVRNTFNFDCNGTKIITAKPTKSSLKAIAFRRGITIININSNRMLGAYGFLKKVFEVFENFKTSVDIVATSEVSISLTIDNTENLDRIKSELDKFSTLEVFANKAIISVIGEGMRTTSGYGAAFFGVLKDINISMVSFGASEINLSIVVDESSLIEALVLLHKEFFE